MILAKNNNTNREKPKEPEPKTHLDFFVGVIGSVVHEV